MNNLFARFKRQTMKNRGQGLVEYVLLLALVSLAVIAIVNVMEPAIGDVFSRLVHKNVVAPPALAGYTPPPPPPTPTPPATPVPHPELIVNATGDGTVTPPVGTHVYSPGQSVTLTAIPDTGWQFYHWESDDFALDGSTSATETIQMTIHKTATAIFVPARYTLTVTRTGSGSVAINPDQTDYAHGEAVILTANPDSGFTFQNWSGDIGGATATDLIITITMDSDKNIAAHFDPACYPLTILAHPSTGGVATPNSAPDCDGGTGYTQDTVVTLTAYPATDYEFDHWSGYATGADLSVDVTMDQPKTVTANFTGNSCFDVVANAVPPSRGSVTLSPSPDCGSRYQAGTNVTFTAIPTNSGSVFNSWSGDLTGNTNPRTITINGNKTINAIFTQAPATLNRRVSASNDDAEETVSNGSMRRASSDLKLIYDNRNQIVGIRFLDVQIQQGATILSAFIEFTADESDSGATSLLFAGQAADNPPAFDNAGYAISGRPRTGASMNWNSIPSWSTGTAYQTPDITTIVQEIVNRGGWSPGNSMVFIISGSGARVAESYNGNPGAAPLLHVEFINP